MREVNSSREMGVNMVGAPGVDEKQNEQQDEDEERQLVAAPGVREREAVAEVRRDRAEHQRHHRGRDVARLPAADQQHAADHLGRERGVHGPRREAMRREELLGAGERVVEVLRLRVGEEQQAERDPEDRGAETVGSGHECVLSRSTLGCARPPRKSGLWHDGSAKMHSLAWTDLQHVLAVADAGSLAAGARALGVNHTTVLRRIAAFEQMLGVKLFVRSPAGYTLTVAGEEVAAGARAMQETAHAVERTIAGRDLRLTGSVRVTSTDTLAASLLLPALASFTRAQPGIALEVTTTNVMANLTRRDADVAVRPTTNPPANLVGRRVATVAIAIYAAPS